MKDIIRIIACSILFAAFSGCSTWGTKVPMGEHRYPRVPREHCLILFAPPSRPHEQIGIVSSLGGAFASDGDMFRKMQMAGADLGADAIIVRSDSATVSTGSGVTVIQNQVTKNYWDYPKTSAIAIKFK